MCLAFFSQIIIVAVPSLLYFSSFLYVCFNFLFSLSLQLHLGALFPSHPSIHIQQHAVAAAAWKCILFFMGELCRARRTRKTREKRQPEEKKTKEFIHKPFVWSGEKLILRLSATDLSAAFALSARDEIIPARRWILNSTIIAAARCVCKWE